MSVRVAEQVRFDLVQVLHGNGRYGARQLTLATDVQAPEGAESIYVQVLERHVHHGIEHVDVPPHAVGVQPTGQLAVPELGDVHMAQFIQRHVAKLGHKQRISVLRHGLELTAVCGWVLPHVDAIRIRKPGLGLPLLPPEVPCHQLRQKILVKINALEADLPPGKDQQFILDGCGNKL
jgi:hypothetical protein